MNEDDKDTKDLLEDLLGRGTVQLFVDATVPGTRLPWHLVGESKVVLNLSWGFKTFMEFDDLGIRADLSFKSKDERVFLPWSSIWFVRELNAETSDYLSGYMCPKRVPEDHQHMFEEIPEPTKPKKNHLRLLH